MQKAREKVQPKTAFAQSQNASSEACSKYKRTCADLCVWARLRRALLRCVCSVRLRLLRAPCICCVRVRGVRLRGVRA
eukprot:6151789-Pleurochrysis_carterae.AAC.1